MHKEELPYWLQNLVVVGREEDEADENDEGQDDEGDEDGEDEGDEEAKGGSDNDGDDQKAKIDALEKALRDERRLRRKAERDAKRKKRQEDSDKDKTEDAETQQKLKAAEEKTQRLAEGFLSRAVDTAILEEARKQGFIDPTDALLDDIRKAVDADQDDEDPTDIDIDPSSVKDAVKNLANRKKHLVGKGTPGEPSGGKFRRKGRSDDQADDQVLMEHYPSLR